MGVGRIFSRWEDFCKTFLGAAKSGEICFIPLENKKTTFFAEILKIQAGQGLPFPPPSDAHTKLSHQR